MGAFDYAADAWGYTYGAAVEWTQSCDDYACASDQRRISASVKSSEHGKP